MRRVIDTLHIFVRRRMITERALALSVFAHYPEDTPLNGDLVGGYEDGIHLGIRWLKPDERAFQVIALECCFSTANQRDDDVSFVSHGDFLDENIIAVDD